jgi:rhodanese-related sulfurtransferase
MRKEFSQGRNSRHPGKEGLYRSFSVLAEAMANPHRLELIDLLSQAPRTVEELAGEARMTIGNTSQHLQRLKRARVVADERQGLYVRYRLADPAVARFWSELRRLAGQQIAEVERALDAYRSRRREFERISVEELRERMARGEVVLLDVRPRVEFDAGHLPGAVSVPLDELERRLEELPPGRTIVAYCRGPYCVYADEALGVLVARGWGVRRLEEGVPEWRELGLPVEAAA